MRINKYLAKCGIGSRRKCDEFISKGFIKVNGVRLGLQSLEQTLRANKIECACLGNDDKIEFFCIKSKFSMSIFRRIIKNLNLRSSNFKLHLITQIPRNESGKILYKELKNAYAKF